VQTAVEPGGVVPLDPFGDGDLDVVDAAPGTLVGEDVTVT